MASSTPALPRMNSRDKGARGEREIVEIYKAEGFDVHRTPMSGGMQWKGDVQGVPGIHVEVKRAENLRLWDALAQARADCPAGDIPALHFRRSRSPWFVAVPLPDFLGLIHAPGQIIRSSG